MTTNPAERGHVRTGADQYSIAILIRPMICASVLMAWSRRQDSSGPPGPAF
jgi:hypothetical protein